MPASGHCRPRLHRTLPAASPLPVQTLIQGRNAASHRARAGASYIRLMPSRFRWLPALHRVNPQSADLQSTRADCGHWPQESHARDRLPHRQGRSLQARCRFDAYPRLRRRRLLPNEYRSRLPRMRSNHVFDPQVRLAPRCGIPTRQRRDVP